MADEHQPPGIQTTFGCFSLNPQSQACKKVSSLFRSLVIRMDSSENLSYFLKIQVG